jgi:CubicO group peptidase (beta-lactamase class C family)
VTARLRFCGPWCNLSSSIGEGDAVLDCAANLEYGVPNTPATVFHLASVSKQFTAFAIYLLAQDGKLSLDDDVRKYLPKLHDFGKVITIRQLLHHTSGVREGRLHRSIGQRVLAF